MTKLEIFNNYVKYLEYEYKNAKGAIDGIHRCYFKPQDVVNGAIDRCLGVAFFVQYLDLDYETTNTIYEKVKEKLEKLLDNIPKA